MNLERMLGPIQRRINNLAVRGVVTLVNATAMCQTLQLRLLSGETKDNVEHMEPYGFTAHPKGGAEGIALFFGGDRSHGVTLVVADRRYRLQGLEAGEVALYDDQGQKVHLTRDGILVKTAKKIRLEGEHLEFHAAKSYSWDVAGYGQRITWVSGTEWEIKTWQQGATVTGVPLPIHPPEGP